MGRRPQPGPRGSRPTLPPRANPGSGTSSGTVLSQREEGRSRGCLQSPGRPREAPGLGSKRSRCPGRTLAGSRRAAWRGHPLMVLPEGLGLPPGLFTCWLPWQWLLPTWPPWAPTPVPTSSFLAAPGHSHPSQSRSSPDCALLGPQSFLLPAPSLFSSVTLSFTGSPVSMCPQSCPALQTSFRM